MARNLPYQSDVDAAYYYAMYADVAAAGVPAARHYHIYGWHEGRNPNEFFDTLGYLTTYQDVAAGGGDPLAHFHNFGFREGRTPSPAFDPQAYLAANPDVAAAGIDPLAHYLRYGRSEGRAAIAKPLYDADGAGNAVTEHAGAGTGTGVTFSWGGFASPNLNYVLAGDTSGGGFAVDYNTGRVYVADASKVDYNGSGPSHSYTVTVTASDLGHTINQSATIAVGNNVPSTPTDGDTATANTVAEGAVAGTYTGLTASASDAGGRVTYSLVGDTSGGGFAIDAATGRVIVADGTKIDYESAPGHAYTVTVVASDGTDSSTQTFTIGVADVAPSAPTEADAATNIVAEGAAAGTRVGLTASSFDVNGPAVTYSLTADSSGGGFRVDVATGVVTVADGTKINYETAPNHIYSVTVAASDGTLTSQQTFNVSVGDVAPSVPTDGDAGTSNSVSEGTAAGTYTGLTAASADPSGGAVTYSLVGDTSNGGFAVDAATGRVTVANGTKLDYETAPDHAYSVIVQASDGAMTSRQTFAIGVTNVNDNAPIANPDNYRTDEDTTLAPTVSVLANDTDADGNQLEAVLVTGPTNGRLALNADGSFTYVPNENFNGIDSFTYKATDGPNDSAPTTVNITVTPVNDPPTATPDMYTLPDPMPPNPGLPTTAFPDFPSLVPSYDEMKALQDALAKQMAEAQKAFQDAMAKQAAEIQKAFDDAAAKQNEALAKQMAAALEAPTGDPSPAPAAADVDHAIDASQPGEGHAIIAADTAETTKLHLDPLAQDDNVTITKLPGNASLTDADGAAVHEGQTLNAEQFAGLAIKPIGTGDTHDAFSFAHDGSQATVSITVQHGSALIGTSADERIIIGPGVETLQGGGGADHFVFDTKALAAAQTATPVVAHVTDYSSAEHDAIDLSALFGKVQDPAAHVADLVRATAAGDGAALEVNVADAGGAAHWVEIARLDHLMADGTVDVALDALHPTQISHLHVEAMHA